MASTNQLAGRIFVVFSCVLLLSCAAPSAPTPEEILNPTESATSTQANMPTASGTPLPATITPAPSPTVVTTATLTPIPTAQPILSESGVLPPGAVARIPPLSNPEGLSSADGKYYLSRSAQSFRVFDTETGEVLWSRYFGQRIYPSESPDERWVAASFSDTVYVWDIETGQLFRTFSDGEHSTSFEGWSPDSKMLVMLSDKESPYFPRVLVLWDPVADEVIFQIDDQKMEIGDILWTQDNRLLITANYAHGQIENEIVIRDASTGERLREMALLLGGTGAYGKPLQASIANLHLSPDETKLAATYGHTGFDTFSVPGLAVLWDVQSGEKLFEFESTAMWDTAFSPDGTQLALSRTGPAFEDPGPSIPIWDTSTGERILELIPPLEAEESATINDLKWSPNGSLIAGVVDGQVHLWDADTGNFIRTLEGSTSLVNWSADGSKLYNSDREWDLVTGEITLFNSSTAGGVGDVEDLAWLPDGSGLAIAGSYRAQLWNVKNIRSASPDHEYQIALNINWTHSIAISPDQKTLATASRYYFDNGSVDLWDAVTGGHLLTLDEGDDVRYYDAAWSPDGKWLATGGSSVKVWDVTSGALDQEYATQDVVIGVDWSSDSRTLVASGLGYVAAWEIEAGRHVVIDTSSRVVFFETPLGQAANVAAFSPDGRYLAVGLGNSVLYPGKILLWDVERQELIQFSGEQPQAVTDLAWSPDGCVLAASGGHSPLEFGAHGFSSGNYSGSVILWDVQTREPLSVLYGHTAEVQAVAFSPDGSLLATGSADGTVLIWDVTTICI